MQEDIFVVRADGNGLRQLTNDVAQDRNPSWSPDSKTITFASNRTSDSHQIWTIGADGSGLQQITLNQSGAHWPIWSPSGTRLAANTDTRSLLFLDGAKRWSDQTVEFVASPLGGFRPRSWSRDGMWIIGTAENNDLGGLLNYSIQSRSFERLRDSGQSPRWLSDGRRIVFADGGRLLLLDVSTKRVRELLSLKEAVVRNVALAPDDHAIYFIPMITDGDIWMATLR
jgi:Tol biopolymer transport system component